MSGQIHQVIENSYLFSGLDTKLIDRIADAATTKTLAANELLFQKGDPADALWGVLSGRVVSEMRSDDGKELVLEAFEDGDVFGEVGVLDFGPRHVAATAEVPSKLFRLERKHFLEHLQSSPELCFRVFSLLCSQLRDTTETLEDTALYKLPKRLAKKLTSLSEANGSHDGDEPVLRVVQSDIARMLGVNREAVNRHLREWEKCGWVSLKHRQIVIHDTKSLADLAAPEPVADRGKWGSDAIGMLPPATFPETARPAHEAVGHDLPTVSILAIDAAEYSGLLMSDAAGTLKRLREGLAAVDKSIANFGGQLIWHAGDRVLAEFSDASGAMQAALAIQASAKETGKSGKDAPAPLFRIGIHSGQAEIGGNRYLGETINVATSLTVLATAGDILVSGQVREALENSASLELPFLGNHEFRNVGDVVSVYSARAVPMWRSLHLRLEARVPKRFRRLYVGAALILAVSIVLLAKDRIGRAFFPPLAPLNSIVVLPFESVGDEDSAYLADGIAEEIRTVLAAVPELTVIGKTSSNYFTGREASAKEIGRTLQVAYVLRGTAGREGDALNVSTQLFDASVGQRIWEHEYHGSWRQFAEFKNDIVAYVARSLEPELAGGVSSVLAVATTNNDEAYALFVQAQNYFWLGRQRFSVNAVPLLRKAVELDPQYAEAHALLAELYWLLDLLDKDPEYTPEIRTELADGSMRMAMALKPNSPFVLAKASAHALRIDDVTQAQNLAEAALSISANDPAALSALNQVYLRLEDFESAMKVTERLLTLEPLSMDTMSRYVMLLTNAGRWEDRREIALRALALYPEETVPQANAWLASSNNQLGDQLGAIESGRKGMPFGLPYDLWAGLDFDWNFKPLNPLRSVGPLAYDERYDQARQILIDEYTRRSGDSSILDSVEYLVNRGVLETLAGNLDQSIELFERARALIPDDEDQLLWSTSYTPWISWTLQSIPSLALLHAYRQTGQDEKANDIAILISEGFAAEKRSSRSTGVSLEQTPFYTEVQFHAIESHRNEALATLRSWRANSKNLFTYVRTDPLLKNLNGSTEFQASVAEIESELAALRAEYYASRSN
jgi:adenylate cyclase